MSLSDDERRDILRLIRAERVGPVTHRRLVERFGTAAAALEALPNLARGGGAKSPSLPAVSEIEDEIDAAREQKAHLLFLGEETYPPLLKHIEDAPPVLFAKGDPGLAARRCLGLVGTRNASINGTRMAGKLAGELGEEGFAIVSGMARGIDGAAHEAAIDTGTIAVLAGGVDVIYPKEHAQLYERLAAEGLVISEMPLGLTPQARHFPRRNRLISGLSEGVIVVEAAKRSGSLITARTALEQGREVFAVPGSPLDPRAQGPNLLIRDGAVLTESAADVTNNLPDVFSPPHPRLGGPSQAIEFEAETPSTPVETPTDFNRAGLEEFLGPTPVAVDELIRQCQMSPAAVTTILLELELAGRIERHPGNRVSLLAKI